MLLLSNISNSFLLFFTNPLLNANIALQKSNISVFWIFLIIFKKLSIVFSTLHSFTIFIALNGPIPLNFT
jgi:hypothetical protein